MLLVVTTHDLDWLDAQIDQTEDIVSRGADTLDPRHLVRTGGARLTYIEDTHNAMRSLTRASLGLCQIARQTNDIVAITNVIALNEHGDAGLLVLQNKQRADRMAKKTISDARDIALEARHLHTRGFENHHTL